MRNKLKTIAKRFKSYLLKKRVESCFEFSVDELLDQINFQLRSLLPRLGIVGGQFVNLGGFNNTGMLLHNSNSGDLKAFTKIQMSDLAEREWRFLAWQAKHFNNQISAQPYLNGVVVGGRLGWLTTEPLWPAGTIQFSELELLYSRLGVCNEKLDYLSLTGKKEGLASDISDDTKIKSLLVHLVSGSGSEKNIRYMEDYYDSRSKVLSGVISKRYYLDILEFIYQSDEIVKGLVHGDFKRQNIMRDDSGCLKVIDLQYYTYGRRVWDLAFYFSRIDCNVGEVFKLLTGSKYFTSSEIKAFFIFYIVACSISVKNKKINKVRGLMIKPALQALNHFEQSIGKI